MIAIFRSEVEQAEKVVNTAQLVLEAFGKPDLMQIEQQRAQLKQLGSR